MKNWKWICRPFKTLKDAPMGMTGHLVFNAWDAETPSTLSEKIIQGIIREQIGFDGLLYTDDLDMEALSGTVPERAELAQKAGCDIALNCWAKMDDMTGITERLSPMSDKTRQRLDDAMATIASPPESPEFAELVTKRDELMAAAA